MNRFAISQEGDKFVIGSHAVTERRLTRDEVLELISWLGATARIGSSEYTTGVLATYAEFESK